MRVKRIRPYRSGRGVSPARLSAKGALIASARTCRFAPSARARTAVNRASGAHRAVAKVLLTPGLPPQVTELNSVSRNARPESWAAPTAEEMLVANTEVARRLSSRGTVG